MNIVLHATVKTLTFAVTESGAAEKHIGSELFDSPDDNRILQDKASLHSSD